VKTLQGAARILDGKKVAAAMRAETAEQVRAFVAGGRPAPRLDVILAGENPASQVYVRNKAKAAGEVGLAAEVHRLPADVAEKTVLDLIAALNADAAVDGILVQMPLPPGIDARKAICMVDPAKDVDGFHPSNTGRLWAGEDVLAPCTPSGIMELLDREGIRIEGREAVVIGRSEIVGKPMAALLLRRHATVTICHSRTSDLAAVCSRGEILIAAVGKAALVTGEFIRPGAVVIDVGVNQVSDPQKVAELFDGDEARLQQVRAKGYTLVGDVHPAQARAKASAITPVPGGVGPLTIAALMRNTLAAARARRGRKG